MVVLKAAKAGGFRLHARPTAMAAPPPPHRVVRGKVGADTAPRRLPREPQEVDAARGPPPWNLGNAQG